MLARSAGTRAEPDPEKSFNITFAGHLVLESVVNDLMDKSGLSGATDIILSGESAGGIGVTPNVDWLQEQVPSARVVGAPIAGLYYYADPYTGPGHTQSGLADFREPAWPQHAELWQSYVNQDCFAAHGGEAWRCVLANYSLPHIRAPLFFTQSKSDKVVLTLHDWVPGDLQPQASVLPYVTKWQANMTQALSTVRAGGGKRHGFFAAACFIHTGFTPSRPLIPYNGRNVSFTQAFDAWVRGATDVFVEDGAVPFSNPTCP